MSDTPDKSDARDWLLLAARVLMMVLFVLFGWQKLTGFGGTVGYFAGLGLSLPELATCVAIGAELGLGLAIVVGFHTRFIAPLLAVYTLVAAFIGHPYWSISGEAQMDAEINFYKNVAIAGGLLLLCVTGAGRYSLDEMGRRDGKAA